MHSAIYSQQKAPNFTQFTDSKKHFTILTAKSPWIYSQQKHLAVLTAKSIWLYSQHKALGYTHSKKHSAILMAKSTWLYSQQKALIYVHSKKQLAMLRAKILMYSLQRFMDQIFIFSIKITNSKC
jgi:hypothetical protein